MLLQRPTIGVCHDLLLFPDKRSPLVMLRFPAQNVPSCTMWFSQFTKYVTKTYHKVWYHPHSTEHDTQPTSYLISKQGVPYRTRGGTCCPRVSTPKIRSLVDSSLQVTSPDGIQPSPPFYPCSNHSIDPHYGQITSRWMGDHISQRHKPNSTSQRMERLV
jgi:hypothetical protein